jgi:hypothetical protein
MARGLLSGALFFFSISLVMIIMILWPDSPWSTWLMEKTELVDDFCWYGEGIWRTNMIWGESGKGLKCSRHGTSEGDAIDEYCAKGEMDTTEAMFNDNTRMCNVTRWGRFCMTFGACVSLIGIMLVVAIHFTTSLETRALRAKRAIFVCVISFSSHLSLFVIIASSPLFTPHHFQYLGKDNQVNYKGLGCVFQSPFVGGVMSLLSSSPLKCLYPGPALPLNIGTVIFQFMGCVMLVLLLRDTREMASTVVPSARPRERGGGGMSSLRAFLFGGNSDSDHYYSLHGALMRKLSKFHRLEQNLAGMIIPTIVLGNGMLLVSWFYHGMQFLVHVKVHNRDIYSVSESGGASSIIVSSDSPLSTILQRFANDTVGFPQFKIVELREQVFTFDPVTSLKTFWDGGGYLLTVITALWLDFFPFLKVFLWHFYWFVPQSEVIRGRVLTWIDYLGKWSLANLFVLCLIASAFLFISSLAIPIPLPFKQVIVVDLECIIASGAGVTWFIISLLWTIALGDVFLQFHTVARSWEEERRKLQNPATPNGEPSIVSPLLRASLMHAGAFEDDTPLPTPTAPSTLGTPNDRRDLSTESATAQPPRASLFREIVRRTSSQFTLLNPSQDGPRQALLDASFAPIFQKERHKFSSFGRTAVWISLVVLQITITFSCFLAPVIHFDKSGAVPDVLLNSKVAEYSILDLIFVIEDFGGRERPAYELALAVVLFALVFPVVHSLGLFFLWGFPFTAKRQLHFFRFMEFCDAWNALDVFFFGLFIVWVGLESISKSVVETVVPGLTQAARVIFGESNVYVIRPTLRYGFWLILASVIGQKIVSHVLMELSAATIAQRQYTERRQGRPTIAEGQRTTNDQISLLSPEELLMFSPAARYVGVSGVNPANIYAGLPRWVWKVGKFIGLTRLEDD